MRKVFFFFNIQILKLYIPKPSPIHGPKPRTGLKPRSLNLRHNTFPIKKKDTTHLWAHMFAYKDSRGLFGPKIWPMISP